jgi:hypothetical protein
VYGSNEGAAAKSFKFLQTSSMAEIIAASGKLPRSLAYITLFIHFGVASAWYHAVRAYAEITSLSFTTVPSVLIMYVLLR